MLKRYVKKIIPLLTALLLMESVSLCVFAADIPNLDKKGSITIVLKDSSTKKRISGGTVVLYRVADPKVEDGNYSWEFREDFEDCGFSLKKISSDELAEDLAEYAQDENIKKKSKTVDSDGKVEFKDLKAGLYLIVQEAAASGYTKVSPFLVSVPLKDDGEWIYDVDASPKMERIRKDHPDKDTKEKDNPKKDQKLPQTGQLYWPVPVLAGLGLTLFTVGWILRFGKRTDDAK